MFLKPLVPMAWLLPQLVATQLVSVELLLAGEEGGAWGWDDQKLSISFSVERDIEETQMDWQG